MDFLEANIKQFDVMLVTDCMDLIKKNCILGDDSEPNQILLDTIKDEYKYVIWQDDEPYYSEDFLRVTDPKEIELFLLTMNGVKK